MQRYAVWFGGSMLAGTVKIHIHTQILCPAFLIITLFLFIARILPSLSHEGCLRRIRSRYLPSQSSIWNHDIILVHLYCFPTFPAKHTARPHLHKFRLNQEKLKLIRHSVEVFSYFFSFLYFIKIKYSMLSCLLI